MLVAAMCAAVPVRAEMSALRRAAAHREGQSLGGRRQRDTLAYSTGLMQPFLNYNFEGGLCLMSAPIVTMNRTADQRAAIDAPPWAVASPLL